MKICVIMPRYSISGVPLAQIRFARALAKRGHRVELLVGFVEPGVVLPAVPEIRVRHLDTRKVRGILPYLYTYLRRERPDIVFAAEDHLTGLVLLTAILARSNAMISGSSRITPYDAYSRTPLTKRWFLKQFMRMVSWRANALTCVSTGMVGEYREIFRSSRHVCVYNIIDDEGSRRRMNDPVHHPWFLDSSVPVLVAAGRLAPWKGYGDLIEAMAVLITRRKARLLILGDGPLRSELQAMIDAKGLTEWVDLLGYVDNPLSYFSAAGTFVHSAHLEGLGNVIVEAMMCGCTPVVTDCPTGPREIVQGGRYGYLVPVGDPEAMAAGIERALDNPIAPEDLAEGVKPFAERAVIDRHFEVLGLTDRVEA